MDLIECNQILINHFNVLKEKREGGSPIFAFEHNLSQDQIEEFFSYLNRTKIRPFKTHRMVWIICCTEIGYNYEGSEYWDSFSKKIPYLDENFTGYREDLRSFFIWFEKTFNGIIPRGTWAKYFVNISHPITHSILPKQFQKLFVEGLDKYSRYADVNTIYEYMYFTCNSKRFKDFLENDHLAKLFLDSILNFENKNEIILKSSLDRIINDLEKEDADFKKRIIKIRGIHDTLKKENKKDKIKFEFSPNLYLRFDANENFKLFLSLPSFLSIPEFIKLTNYRLRFSGSPVLFRGDQLINEAGNDVLLNKLTYGTEDFCHFLLSSEASEEDIDLNKRFKDFMNSELQFLNDECILFEVNEDGFGQYLIDKTLETNKSYAVISKEKLSFSSGNNKIQYHYNEKFHLYKFDNDNYDELSKSFLRLCNISSPSKIIFKPVGTIERGKNKNFYEYLVGESPIFFVEATNDVFKCEIKYNNKTKISLVEDNKLFFELENLTQGSYDLFVKPFKKSPAGYDLELDTIGKKILVRPPNLEVGFQNNALFFSFNQNQVTLQNFWENKLDFQIFGPSQIYSKITLSLYDENDLLVLKNEIFKDITLPITSEIWVKKFDQVKSKLSKDYLISNSALLEVEAFEVGSITQKFENIQYPLKLTVNQNKNEVFIKIKNETSLDFNNANIDKSFLFYSFEKPLFVKNLTPLLNNSVDLNFKVEDTGGCYIIQIKDKDQIFLDQICVSKKSNKKNIQGFGVLEQYQVKEIDLSDFDKIKNIGKFQILHFWKNARIVGENFTYMKIQYIFDKILDMIYKEFYSISWYNTLLEDKEYDLKLNGLIRNLSSKINSSRIIDNKIHLPFRDELEKIINKSNDYGNISFNYYELCSMRNISHDAKLIAFSLHLAFEPLDLYKRYGKEISTLVAKLIQNNDLSRSSKILYYIYCMKNFKKFIKIPVGGYFD